jgi:hypothetical protein
MDQRDAPIDVRRHGRLARGVEVNRAELGLGRRAGAVLMLVRLSARNRGEEKNDTTRSPQSTGGQEGLSYHPPGD